jgi:hypothetical protein
MDLLAAIGRYRGVHHFGCGSKLDGTRSIQFAPRIWRKRELICSRHEYNLSACRRPGTPVALTLRGSFFIR